MADERTPEQMAADDALDTAIRNAVVAHGLPADRLVLRWIVLAKTSGVAEDGSGSIDGNPILMPTEDVQWSDLLGMLRVATLRSEQEYLAALADGE